MNLKPSQIVILAAGVIVLVFSFFNFYSIDTGDTEGIREQCESVSREDVPEEFRADYDRACGVASDGGFNAWSMDFYFPLSTWPAILGVVVAGLTAASAFGGVTLPEVLGLRPRQLLFGLALPGALMMLGWLIMGTEEGASWGIGFWLMLLGSLALVVGTAMELLADDDASTPRAGSTPPTPF